MLLFILCINSCSRNSEQEILREEINSLQAVKTKLQGRIKDLEEDLKKTREDLEKKNQAAQEQENEVINLIHADYLNDCLLFVTDRLYSVLQGFRSCT